MNSPYHNIFPFLLEPFEVGPPKLESRRKETKQSITYNLEIKSEFKPNQIKPLINPPSSRGLVFAPTTLAFLANCIGPTVTILCDCAIRHLDMFYNAKYLSWHRLRPKAIGLEFSHIK